MKKEGFIIEPVTEKSRPGFCACLEEWSEEIREAGSLRSDWYDQMKGKGLGALIARNDRDDYVGMVQYIPGDYAAVEGKDFYHIFCTWVHAYKGKGVGDQRKQGIGKALLQAAEEDIRNRGAAGITAWGLSLPFWMKASWYKKQGYRRVDSNGAASLMWKPLKEGASPPRWLKASPELKDPGEGQKLKILSVINGICTGLNIGHERIRQLAEEYADRVDYQVVRTDTPAGLLRWGIADGLFIGGKSIALGPPPKTAALRKILEKELKKRK